MNGVVENGIDQDQFAHLEEQNADLQPAEEETPRKVELLPENRQERLAILLRNITNEDLIHINDKKIPAFLRIDKDVQEQRSKLSELHVRYMDFNITELDEEVRESLRTKIVEVSQDFIQHRIKTELQIRRGDDVKKNSLALQDQTQSMRIDQNKNITSALQESKQSLLQIDNQNKKMAEMRDKLEQMQANYRRMQNDIRSAEIHNENLKNVQSFEQQLRQARDK